MKKVVKLISLNREANLFDAELYILKAFVSVLTAYAIVQRLPLIHKDLISVLFGLMMTLEPVTVTGIRSGIRQVTATILGALLTALFVAVFGINLWTVALSVSATLYLCLKINWREVSPVAIFTSIYMTNYVQYTVSGEPSVILTFQLRILSLITGVLIAVLYNFLFSGFFYRRMERKRIAHIFILLSEHLKLLKAGIAEGSEVSANQVKAVLSDTLHKIDWLSSLIEDKEKESRVFRRMSSQDKQGEAQSYHKVLTELGNITHLIYDTIYYLTDQRNTLPMVELQTAAGGMDKLISECSYLANSYADNNRKYKDRQVQEEPLFPSGDNRMMINLRRIDELFQSLRNIGI